VPLPPGDFDDATTDSGKDVEQELEEDDVRQQRATGNKKEASHPPHKPSPTCRLHHRGRRAEEAMPPRCSNCTAAGDGNGTGDDLEVQDVCQQQQQKQLLRCGKPTTDKESYLLTSGMISECYTVWLLLIDLLAYIANYP